jgi:hypothetical protein
VNRAFEFTSRDFDVVRRLASELTGIVGGEDQRSMCNSRLARRLLAF